MTYTFESSEEIINFTYQVILKEQGKQLTQATIHRFAKIVMTSRGYRLLAESNLEPDQEAEMHKIATTNSLEDSIISIACALPIDIVTEINDEIGYNYSDFMRDALDKSDSTNVADQIRNHLKQKGYIIDEGQRHPRDHGRS